MPCNQHLVVLFSNKSFGDLYGLSYFSLVSDTFQENEYPLFNFEFWISVKGNRSYIIFQSRVGAFPAWPVHPNVIIARTKLKHKTTGTIFISSSHSEY